MHKSKYGYAVSAPSLPGCHSQGATQVDALRNIQDAIKTYLALEKSELKHTQMREVEVALA